jgi:hypothetical protein
VWNASRHTDNIYGNDTGNSPLLLQSTASLDNFSNGSADSFANPPNRGEIRVCSDELADAFGESSDCLRCSPIRLEVEGVLFLQAEQLRKAEKDSRDLGVT